MADNLNSAVDMLKGLLGNDAEEKIKSLFSSEPEKQYDEPIETESTKAIQVMNNNNDYAERIRSLFNELSSSNDPRSQLLMSLKPYMNESRRKGIDNAVKLLNISKLSGMFK